MIPSIILSKHHHKNISSDKVIVLPAELDSQQQLLTPLQSPVLKRRIHVQGLSEESDLKALFNLLNLEISMMCP